MAKSKKAAAAAIVITEHCERHEDGYGALPFVQGHKHFNASRKAVSELKAQLLTAGFESSEVGLAEWLQTNDAAEIRERWEESYDVLGWDPVAEGAGWTMVALLCLADDNEEVTDAVAVFARPAGMVDQVPADKPWPFPKGESGGPEVESEQPPAGPVPTCSESQTVAPPAAPMTKSEAHLGRKSGRFELPEQTEVKLKSWTPRTEKHGDDDVSASSMGFKLRAPNTILDSLLPSLRAALYAAPEGQTTLPGVDESTPLLRSKGIEQLKLTPVFEGWTLRIYHGIDEDEPFVIGGCKVDKFELVPHDGGSVDLDFRVGSSDIDEHEAGWLYGNQKREIVVSLHAPQAKPEPIDGSVGHPGLAELKTAGDLFAEQHGQPDDDAEPPSDEDEDAAAHGGDGNADGGSDERELDDVPAEEGAES